MKILIELTLDGHETRKQEQDACLEFVFEQLNMTASGVKILWHEELDEDKL